MYVCIGEPSVSHPATAAPVKSDYECEGDSDLVIRISTGSAAASYAYNYNDGFDLMQKIGTPHLIITNPTNAQISITEFWIEVAVPNNNGYSFMYRYL